MVNVRLKYVKCQSCGWIHLVEPAVDAPWRCYNCGNTDRKSFVKALKKDIPVGSTIQPVNRRPFQDFKGSLPKISVPIQQAIDESVDEAMSEEFELSVKVDLKEQKVWRIKITRGNTILIPAQLRDTFNVQPGDEVEMIWRNGMLVLISAANRPSAYMKLFKFASEVFGDKTEALLWLHEAQYGLDEAIPVQHMRTRKGAKEVEELLGRIEYGVLI